jgi:hypothetical protein
LRPRKAVGSSVLTLKDLYLDVSVKVLDVAQDPVDGLFEFGFSPYEWHGGQEVQKREGVVSVDIVSSIIPSDSDNGMFVQLGSARSLSPTLIYGLA